MGIACVAGGIRASAVVFWRAEQLRRSLRVATEPPRKSPGKRIQVTQARVGKKDTLLKKLIRLVSSNIYSNVLKA